MSHPADPTHSTVKKLLALSNNICAFRDPSHRLPTCEQRLVEPDWKQVVAHVCHIYGKKRNSAGYDPSVPVERLRHFDNLILFCPTHHTIVDNAEADRFTVEVLTQMKLIALENPVPCGAWASGQLLERATEALHMTMIRLERAGPLKTVSMTDPPPGRSVLERKNRQELMDIAQKMSVKRNDNRTKRDIIDEILESTGLSTESTNDVADDSADTPSGPTATYRFDTGSQIRDFRDWLGETYPGLPTATTAGTLS